MAHTLHDRALALWKLCASFRKRDWQLDDYPVVIKEQCIEPPPEGTRWKPLRYMAFIVRWGLAGSGDTEQDALQDLERVFASEKAERQRMQQPLPRPGTTVQVQFASSQRVDAHSELATDFIHRVLKLDWAWISDDSTLWDFHASESNDALLAKVLEVYGVDVSDISTALLWEIFDRIAAHRSVVIAAKGS